MNVITRYAIHTVGKAVLRFILAWTSNIARSILKWIKSSIPLLIYLAWSRPSPPSPWRQSLESAVEWRQYQTATAWTYLLRQPADKVMCYTLWLFGAKWRFWRKSNIDIHPWSPVMSLWWILWSFLYINQTYICVPSNSLSTFLPSFFNYPSTYLYVCLLLFLSLSEAETDRQRTEKDRLN